MDHTGRQKVICHSYFLVFGMFGVGLIAPLVKTFEDTYGLSHSQMGSLLGIGLIMLAVWSLIGGMLYDRFGARLVMFCSLILCAASAVAIRTTTSAVAFAAALLLFNSSNGMAQMINAYVGRLYGYGEKRKRGLNLFHGFMGVGRLISPAIVAACIASYSWRLSFDIAAVIFVIWAMLFLLGLRRRPGQAVPTQASPPEAHSNKGYLRDWRGWVCLAGVAIGTRRESVSISWLPNFLESEAGLEKQTALLALTAMLAGYAFVRIFMGLRRKKIGYGFVLTSLAAILGGYALILNFQHPLVLFPVSFLIGFGFGWHWPTLAGTVYDFTHKGHGTLTGVFMMATMTGAFIFLSGAGLLGDIFSLKTAMLIAPACGVVASLLYCVLIFASRRQAAAG